MEDVLKKVNDTKDVKKLNIQEKKRLAEQIRDLLLISVSKTGGHLASNLGVVELTIALHSIFDTPTDKIIWDVGHQSYVHKILTGRKNKLDNLRQLNGIAGFPKINESKHDCFNTGHSSTSISVALGMAKARDLKGEKHSVIAVIGDGALTGGMALEAMNDAGCKNTNIIVILNDNEMSISKNTGGISAFLTKIRTRKLYRTSNNIAKRLLNKIPVVGTAIVSLCHRIKMMIKNIVLKDIMFESLGYKYLGPIDGHDIEKIEEVLKKAKAIQGPVLVHVLTKKGKGYPFAEENPAKYHSTSAFNIEDGQAIKSKKADYSKVFGDKLVELAKKDDRIVAITAAMTDGTGLTKFKEIFPDRLFDVGIAEQHALGMAAGLAANGLKPVVSIYSSFYQRAYDQIIHDICIQKLPVVLCIDRAGVVGNDGETHQGVFDLSFLSVIPNLEILAPKNFKELEKMLEYAINCEHPIAIRYPRGGQGEIRFKQNQQIKTGRAEKIKNGEDVSLIAIGKMVERAKEVSDILEKEGINAEIINTRFLKPLDKKMILNSINKTRFVVTIEDNVLKGGLASAINDLIVEKNVGHLKVINIGYPDEFVKHGNVCEIEKKYGLDVKSIVDKIHKKNKEKIEFKYKKKRKKSKNNLKDKKEKVIDE